MESTQIYKRCMTVNQQSKAVHWGGSVFKRKGCLCPCCRRADYNEILLIF